MRPNSVLVCLRRHSIAIPMLLLVSIFVNQGKTENDGNSEMKIRITFGGTQLTATLHDSEASREFVSMLPLTLTLRDYAATEKVSNLPRKLSTASSPAGFDPSIGDITYYAPWENLAIFYKDFSYAEGLVKLGSFDNGIEKLGKMTGQFETVFELIE